MELSRLEQEVMEQILRGEFEGVEIARKQCECATVSERKYTGAGFFTSLVVPTSVEKLPNSLPLRQAFFDRASASVTTDPDEVIVFHLWENEEGYISTIEGVITSGKERWPNESEIKVNVW